MAADQVEVDVFRMLSMVDAGVLEGICNELSIDIPPAKQGNTLLLQKLILRYLNSEDMETKDDQGLAIFLKLQTDLCEMVKKQEISGEDKKSNDVKIKVENDLVHENLDIKPIVQVQRLRV